MIRKLLVPATALATTAILAGVAVGAASPTVRTGKPTRIADSTAVLNGTLNPNGASTTYYFQYGLTSGYGTNTAPRSAGAGVRGINVARTATGLVAGTVYHYRLVATNQFGTTVGADRAFTTTGHPPPGVLTGAAGRLSATGATLVGAVYPQGASTIWFFQWGTSNAYGQNTEAQRLPASGTPQVVASTLSSIAPGVIYHFRLVASHGGNTFTYGNDQIFMTYPSPRPVPTVTASTKPSLARSKPYTLTTTGQVTAPASIPSQFGCNGNVTIRFFRFFPSIHKLRQVGFTLAGIQPNCSFSARTVFNTIPGGRPLHPNRPVQLQVVTRSISNNYLSTNRAPYEHVKIG
jgi:hypothetical protein